MPPTEQLDFSGGVNLVDDPCDLNEREVADAQNVRLVTKSTIEQRLGYTQYNSSAIAAAAVTSLHQMRDYQANLIPLAQCNGTLSKGSSAYSGTGSFSSILTETAGYGIGCMDDMWGRLIYTNNSDVPKTYEGTYSKCYGFKKTVDGTNYIDYTTQVADEDSSTYADLGALDVLGNNDWVVIRARVPKIKGIRLVVHGTNKNANTADVAIFYRSAVSTWTTVGVSLADGTATGGKTLDKTGDVTFTEVTCVLDDINGIYGYYLRLSVSAALSANVQILAAYIIYDMQSLPNFWVGDFLPVDGFKKSVDNGVTFVDYSVEVSDGALSTVATLGALPATTGFWYVHTAKKIRGIRVTMSSTNVNTTAASTLTCTTWDGDSWAAVTITDGTSANSITLAQSGTITWAWPTTAQVLKGPSDIIPLYQFRFVCDKVMSTNVDIAEIEVLEEVEALKVHKLCIYHKNRLFLVNRPDAQNYLFYSATFLPDVFNGDDTGYIGIPSGKPITAICRFFNELFVATADEIYLLQGFSPQTFGLLKINTGGIGAVSQQSTFAVGKFIYFAHSTGFYRFDGMGVILLSGKINHFFDAAQATYFIPASRLAYIQGRYDRIHNRAEWTVSKGSAQATNNCICIFDLNEEGWWFDNITAASLLRTTDATFVDLIYHGDYAGRVHRDWSGTNDNGTAISAYVTSRGFGKKDFVSVFTAVGAKVNVESSGSVTVTYAARGASAFTSLGSLALARSGYTYSWQDIHEPIFGQTVQYKFAQATNNLTFTMTGIRVFSRLVRADFIQI